MIGQALFPGFDKSNVKKIKLNILIQHLRIWYKLEKLNKYK